MKSHELTVKANKERTRSGRGIAAGRGKTAGRGTKGQNSRTGGKVKPGFEGGQNPIMRRLPKKRGFRSLARKAQTVYTGSLAKAGSEVTNESLFKAGLIADQFSSVKVISKGDVSSKLDVQLAGASVGAIAQIEKAGGKFTTLEANLRPKLKKSE
jgi:large subunit ribosomal protein L15